MEIRIHRAPRCEPFEYWCGQCRTLNLSFVPFEICPICGGEILKGALMELDADQLRASR